MRRGFGLSLTLGLAVAATLGSLGRAAPPAGPGGVFEKALGKK